jgi:hypothetical protein
MHLYLYDPDARTNRNGQYARSAAALQNTPPPPRLVVLLDP